MMNVFVLPFKIEFPPADEVSEYVIHVVEMHSSIYEYFGKFLHHLLHINQICTYSPREIFNGENFLRSFGSL